MTAVVDAASGSPEPAPADGRDRSVTALPARAGVGSRLDALMAAAEREAAEIREHAESHAAALLTQAHAELDRHEQDQRLRWRERDSALAERERLVLSRETAAREQAEQVMGAAEHQARAVLAHARLEARAMTDTARDEAEKLLVRARAEADRLDQHRERAHADVARLLRTLDGLRTALAYELETTVSADPTGFPEPDRPDVTPASPHPAALHDPRRDPGEVGDGFADRETPPPPARASVTDRADGWLLGRRRGDHRRVSIADPADPPA